MRNLEGTKQEARFDSAARFLFALVVTVPALAAMASGAQLAEKRPEEPLALERAQEILNDSPWARQQTVTRVLHGIGSGEYGEKEIFSRYYVRILSAEPVKRAFATIRRVLFGEETGGLPDIVDSYEDGFIVIGLAFRSNQPDEESEVQNALRAQTVETLKNRSYLSTAGFPQVQLVGYYPPSEPSVGAQFVFPGRRNGRSIIRQEDGSFAFELDLPGQYSRLRVTFPVTSEVVFPDSASAEQLPVSEAVDEFRVLRQKSGRIEVDASRFAGLVNVFPQQTRARAFHGSIYEFHRNDNLDARNFFDPVGEPLPEFKRNQFGGSLGVEVGSRIGLFGSYDGLRIIQGSTLLSNVPSQAMKRGDFRELLELDVPIQLVDPDTREPFPDNQIPSHRIHPVSSELLSLLPDPNLRDEVRNFVNSQPLVEDRDLASFRADVGLTSVSQLVGQFELSNAEEVSVHPFPAFGSRGDERGYRGSISYTRTFGENTISTWRLVVDRERRSQAARDERPAGLLGSLGIDGVQVSGPEDEGYPSFEVEGYPDFGDAGLPENEVDNHFYFENEGTLARGNHRVQVSGSFQFRQVNDSRSSSLERGDFGFTGYFSGHAFADFLLGRADSATRALGTSRQDLRRASFRLSFLDEWRIVPRFTLSYGASYQYYGPYRSIRNNLSVFRPLLFEPPPDGEIIDLSGTANTVVGSDWNDFAPRLGVAYRPFGSNRFVVRGSYAIYYDPLPSWVFEHFMGRNYPHYYRQASQASIDGGGLDLSSPFDTDTPTELEILDISPDVPTPYEHSWDLTLGNEITDDWTLDITTRGRRGQKEFRFVPGNVPLPGPGELQPRRPNSDFGPFTIVTAGGTSIFYELQVDVQRRFSRGFSLDASFEWRRRFDDDFADEPSNPRNLAAEWSPGDYFHDRRFRLNYIVDLPFGENRPFGKVPYFDVLLGGWRVSGYGQISTGLPFSILLPGDFNNDGVSTDRPDRLASGHLPSTERSIDRWFDLEAFAAPEPYTFGNAGRNILVGPPYHNWDMSLIKNFLLYNGHQLELRFAFFNAFNHANFETPNHVLGTRLFGVVTGAERAREIEIAVKYSF